MERVDHSELVVADKMLGKSVPHYIEDGAFMREEYRHMIRIIYMFRFPYCSGFVVGINFAMFKAIGGNVSCTVTGPDGYARSVFSSDLFVAECGVVALNMENPYVRKEVKALKELEA